MMGLLYLFCVDSLLLHEGALVESLLELLCEGEKTFTRGNKEVEESFNITELVGYWIGGLREEHPRTVGEIDAQLLKGVLLKDLKAEDLKDKRPSKSISQA